MTVLPLREACPTRLRSLCTTVGPRVYRSLFAFDPRRASIPLAEHRYETYLKERAEEEGGGPWVPSESTTGR